MGGGSEHELACTFHGIEICLCFMKQLQFSLEELWLITTLGFFFNTLFIVNSISLLCVSQICMPLLGTDSELSATSYLFVLFPKVWWDFSASLSLKFVPGLLCLDKDDQWGMRLSLTVNKIIFSFLRVLAPHTFSPMSTAEFPQQLCVTSEP